MDWLHSEHFDMSQQEVLMIAAIHLEEGPAIVHAGSLLLGHLM